MIAIARETFGTIRDDLMPLWQRHYDEVAEDKEVVPLDPDWEKYAVLALRGSLAVVTARRDGAIVGYVFAVVDTHLHYRSTRFAMLDLYYLRPDCRGGRTFVRMLIEMQTMLRQVGVVKVIGNTKLAHDQGRVFRALGWREAERIFVKVLEAA
jgi:hypothetical protein